MNVVLSSNGSRRGAWRIGTLLLGAILLVSCEKKPAEQSAPEPGTIPLNFSTSIAAGVRPETKAAPIAGNKFPPRNGSYPIGMWICEHEQTPASSFVPAMDGYDNLLVSLSVAAKDEGVNEELWSYTFGGRSHNTLSVQQGRAVDIYAYHPRVEAAGEEMSFPPTAIPFTSGESDWMWAEPRSLTAEETEVGANLQPVQVPLRFHHAMTCIEVRIKCKYSGNVSLTSMTLTDSESRLYAKGTLNALDGVLTPDESSKSDQIAISPKTTLGTSEQSFCIIMPPVENYEDEQFTLSFVFNGIDGRDTFSLPATMKKLGSPDETVTVTEFKAGTRYIYRLTLDNTMRLAPVGVDEEWTNEEIDLEL